MSISNIHGETTEWSGVREIRELINELITREVEGYTHIELVTENESYEPDGEEGRIKYKEVPKLKFN